MSGIYFFAGVQTRQFFSPALLAGCLGLAGCDTLDEYISSGADQDFTRYIPGVAQPPAVDGSGSDSGSDGGTTASVPSIPSAPDPVTDTPVDSGADAGDTPTTGDDVNAPSLAGSGIVWKPVSEGNGNLVVLTPTSYGTPGITILDNAGRVVENGAYVGHTNGNRATYRFSKPGGAYRSPAYLRVNNSLFLVSSTASRYN